MEIELSDNWIKKLQELPETGMGYQIVNLILTNGKVFDYIIVLNCSIVIIEEKIEISQIKNIELADV